MERLTARTENGKVIFVGDFLNTPNYEEAVFNRLAELEDKLESGRLAELPCKVGDTVYRRLGSGYYDELVVVQINLYTTQYKVDYCLCAKDEMGGQYFFEKEDEGDEWFLTKEAAEARLKELKEQKNEEN